jgi:hypothetical protein
MARLLVAKKGWLDYHSPTRPILPDTFDQLFKFRLTSLVIHLEEAFDGGTS